MKNKIVLNLSNVSEKLRAFIAQQVKNNLVSLGFNIDGKADHNHPGFSLAKDGDKLNVEFDWNNENQMNRHMLNGSRVFNEHQLGEFFQAAKELALGSRSGIAEDTKEATKERVVEREILGVPVSMCQHGCVVKINRESAAKIFSGLLAEGPSFLDKLTEEAIKVAKAEGLITENANVVGPFVFGA